MRLMGRPLCMQLRCEIVPLCFFAVMLTAGTVADDRSQRVRLKLTPQQEAAAPRAVQEWLLADLHRPVARVAG